MKFETSGDAYRAMTVIATKHARHLIASGVIARPTPFQLALMIDAATREVFWTLFVTGGFVLSTLN